MESKNEHIIVERRGTGLILTLNRPQVRNALHPPAHDELSRAFDRLEADDSVHYAVVTGAGDKAFCTGSDLKFRAETGETYIPPMGFAGLTERFGLDKPVIAAINGDAVGGGMEIVLACDLAIAVKGARFGFPEPKVGLAASGGLHRLIRQIPTKFAMQIALKSELFSAGEALALGLVNAVVEPQELNDEIDKLIQTLEANAPLSLRATKQMMLAGLDEPSLEAAFAGSYPAYETMLASEDAVEGPLAFSQKRKPKWRAR
ncbi:MAG: enoyl-CoA hydratase [Rhodospirillaceae bacterium]|nr:enoyl-CoA hydratase [Alphaproteobacteria bacterium]MBT4931828.1 enoyl-CoA hydratase [Rhodospirillaceae bacterium]MBT5243203.1 enoyl-CoA hydratase [Rhodospirillaceae bacterium]MBT6243742.1 enoyl-CoA hydratase [Rhodospirillaceae bacterium]MBT7942817.1 enoyl-CoA hydratase [Alphaproteobacteria bacterium]